MMTDFVRASISQQILTLDPHIKLVVIHPNYTPQHHVLSEILAGEHPVYVCFTGKKLNQSQLREQFEQALQDQNGGVQLSSVTSLVLDECDRADSAAFSIFLPEIIAGLGDTRLFIISRVLPECVVNNDSLRAISRFIPSDDSLMYWDYTALNREKHLLEVRAFGSGRVLLDGKLVDNWDGVLPRSLFFYLVDRGMTTRNEIFATFWPNLQIKEATNVFHVTKRKISEVLGTDLTMFWSGFYRISPHIQLSYDAVQLTEMVQASAVASPQETTELLLRAILLYRGNFLTSINAPWVKRRREELLQLYSDVLVGLARQLEHNADGRQALGLYLRAAANNPHREDLALNIINLYWKLGMAEEALLTYDRLKQELSTTLGVAPAPNLIQVVEQIKKSLKS